MNRRLFSIALLLAALLCLTQQLQLRAQLTTTGVGGGFGVSSGFSPSCSASTNWLARATGVTLTADKQNYDNLLCGLVTDGVLAKGDVLYVYVTVDIATAKLNLLQNAFNATQTGTPSGGFTAYTGITGDAAAFFFDTGFAPNSAGGNWTVNSASMASCNLTSRTAGQSYADLGTQETGFLARMITNFGGTTFFWALNDTTLSTTANTNSQGFWVENRSGASALQLYLNGNTTPFGTDTFSSNALATNNLYAFAENNGSNAATSFTGDKLGAAWFGGSLSSTDQQKLYNRLHTYFAAYSVTGC